MRIYTISHPHSPGKNKRAISVIVQVEVNQPLHRHVSGFAATPPGLRIDVRAGLAPLTDARRVLARLRERGKGDHSTRSASTGLRKLARRAGNKHASTAGWRRTAMVELRRRGL